MDEFLSRLNQPVLQQIIQLLPADEPFYLVGGAIRDALLNRPNYDLDFITPGDALKIGRRVADNLGAAYFPLDRVRKVARLIIKRDEGRLGIGDKTTRIDFSTFQGGDLLSDLQGRDFTINAMAVEVHKIHGLVDPLGGAGDLVSKRLITCSQTSFLDDPVRILRAARFSVDLGLKIMPEMLKLVRQATHRINEVSAERLRDELFRILTQAHPETSLRILDKFEALDQLLPEVSQLKGIGQSPPHVLDAWEHSMDLLTRLEGILDILAARYDPDNPANLMVSLIALRLGRYREKFQAHINLELNPERPHRGLLLFAGLYHDVGKQVSQTVSESGRIRFIEHEQIGSEMVENRARDLKLSNLEVERLVTVVRHHMRLAQLSHQGEMPSRKAIYRFFRETGAAGVDICLLSLADMLATYGPTLPQERWMRHLDVVRALLEAWWDEQPRKIMPQPVINGDDLKVALGLPAGQLIGDILEAIREGQAVGDIKNREEALELARRIAGEDQGKISSR